MIDLGFLNDSNLFAQIEWHAEIDSTNTRAIALAGDAGVTTPCLIGAERQSAGRGRGNNRWWSGAGSLTFSLVLDPATDFVSTTIPPLEATQWPRLSLAAAVALCEVLADRAPRGRPRLKWPNDVHLEGRKVAGILMEAPPAAGNTARRLVLGMGVNVNNSLADAPEEIRNSAIALIDAMGKPTDRSELLCDWMRRFRDHARLLAQEDPELANAWRAFCLLAGQTVSLRAGERTVAGLCLGIDDQGALLIDTPAGTERCFGGVLVRVQPSPERNSAIG